MGMHSNIALYLLLSLSVYVSPAVLYFLLQVSFLVDEGVSPVLLQLLSCALCGSKVLASSTSSSFSGGSSGSTGQMGASQTSQSKSSSKKSKKEDKEKDKDGGFLVSKYIHLYSKFKLHFQGKHDFKSYPTSMATDFLYCTIFSAHYR